MTVSAVWTIADIFNGLTITIRVNPETYADAPADCYTVTYNRNSQLQAFYYCPRHEYTY